MNPARPTLAAARTAAVEAQRRLTLARRAAAQRPGADVAARLRAAEDSYRAAKEGLVRLRDQQPGLTEAILDPGAPVALLPVRIETRFRSEGARPQLLVRVYPDALVADAHEPLLSDSEAAAGRAFWQAGWEPEAEAAAWTALWGTYGGPRAAWIARATQPSNLADRPAGTPVFEEIETRAEGLTMFPQARLLPQRWLVVAYRGDAEVKRASGGAIREPLALSLSLGTDAEAADLVDLSGDGLQIERDVAWTLDFAEAEAAGMALRIDLDANDLRLGFSRVVVLGLDADNDPDGGAAALEALLEAQRYSRGFGFVAQGAATNNSTLGPAAYPPATAADSDFTRERAERTLDDADDGARFAAALGIATQSVARADGADGAEQTRAEAMASALWPVTLGYALSNLLLMAPDDDDIETVRSHFAAYVRGRGPLPAFRVGDLPYGVLPVLPPGGADATSGDAVQRHLPALIEALRAVWEEAAEGAPRIDRTGDDDADLLETLGQDASAREVRIRSGVGPDATRNILELTGEETTQWYALQAELSRWAADALGLMAWNPRILGLTFASNASTFNGDLVTGPLSETDPLAFDYIAWLRTQGALSLREEAFPEDVEAPSDLLYALLRQAILVEFDRAARLLYRQAGQLSPAELVEPELLRIVPGTLDRKTSWDRLADPLLSVSGSEPLATYLGRIAIPQTIALNATRAALAPLEGVPTAELERLLAETLDLCASRLDAWVTSLATRRLAEVRKQRPRGVHIGAYGWVEDLRPRSGDQRVQLADGTAAIRQPDAEFVHAPSLDQAGAAAVLRNGYLTRRDEGGGEAAVDLSPARVRTALSILDGVRSGQSVGAVFGYLLERTLHDAHLDAYIDPLRALYPLTSAQRGTGERSALAGARNVVHGLDARTAWQSDGVPWGSAGLPASGADRDAIEAAFATLDAAVDAVGDLLLSESVYRLVTGNVAAGGASLDSLASGVRPPEPAFAEAPRSGTPITHRVALVLRDDTLPAAWTAIPLTPRALAEPRLNAWTAGLLGDPALVRCTVRVASAGGTERIAEVTLAALGMQPLDVLVVLSTLGESLGATSELDRRVAIAAGATATDTVTITYERAASETASAWRTFAEAAEVARAIAAALSVARPLAVGDLVLPEDGGEATATSAADGRAAAVQSALADAATALSNAATATAASDTTATRAALVAALMGIAAFGIAGTVPLPGAATAGLLTLAASAGTEAARRIASAAAATDDASRVAACLGAHAWYLPAFTPDGAEGLADALAARGSLVTSAREPRRWLRQAAMVREPLGAWRRAWAYGATFGSLAPAVDLVQWPGMGGRWCALPFDAPEERPRAGTTALVAWTDGGTLPSAAETWSGLLIDQWVDLIPASEETTGIAFRYDAPGAAAPQAVILAVPPTGLKAWDADTLLGTIGEAIALVRLRAVDGDLLGALAQALPAIYVAENPAGDAISLRLSDRLIADPTILGLRALGGTS